MSGKTANPQETGSLLTTATTTTTGANLTRSDDVSDSSSKETVKYTKKKEARASKGPTGIKLALHTMSNHVQAVHHTAGKQEDLSVALDSLLLRLDAIDERMRHVDTGMTRRGGTSLCCWTCT
jgi:hypothetical protein